MHKMCMYSTMQGFKVTQMFTTILLKGMVVLHYFILLKCILQMSLSMPLSISTLLCTGHNWL